jgi:hypothetical protein
MITQQTVKVITTSLLTTCLWLLPSLAQSSAQSSANTPQTLLTNALTQADYQWMGQKIYQNECAGKPEYLTHWGAREDFPSFGIGHFIWYPPKVTQTFVATFEPMVRFVAQQSAPPAWLQAQLQQGQLLAPWSSKSQFDQAWSSEPMQQLRDWLARTHAPQARFIVEQFSVRWQSALQGLSLAEQQRLNARLAKLMAFKQGQFAVIDYFNFKGIGQNAQEQYQGESWGLISVINDLPHTLFTDSASQSALLNGFMHSAKSRLALRVALAPAARQEAKWLTGWHSRIDGYAIP